MRLAPATPVSGEPFLPWRTLLLTLLALALYLGIGPAPAGLVLDRAGLGAGEWWRLFAAHWVHSDAAHALWNIAALAFLGALFERRLGWRMVAALALGMLCVSLWVVLGLQLQRYCGLSGILNSLLAAGLVVTWRDTRDPLVLLVGAGAVLKIVVETALGQAVFTSAAWASVPTAHAAGFVAGLAAAWSSTQVGSARAAEPNGVFGSWVYNVKLRGAPP